MWARVDKEGGEREPETDRGRERERDRQTDIHRGTETDRQAHRGTGGGSHTCAGRWWEVHDALQVPPTAAAADSHRSSHSPSAALP